jgi:phage protein D
MGNKIGAIVAPKDGHLLVTERRSGKSASGKALPTIYVIPTKLISGSAYYVRIKPRSRYSKVIAKWNDRAAGRTKSLTLKAAEKGPSMTLREVFQSEAGATKAAEAKAVELRAGEGELALEWECERS